MKNRNVLNMLFGGFALLPALAFAQGGHVGGGDTCRDEINKHRETLYQWIQAGDASDLDFSQSKTEVRNFAEYQKRMLDVLESEKVVVTCYLDPARIQDPVAQKIASEQGVSYRAITLTNPETGIAEPTACINYEDQLGAPHIDCNYDSIVNQKALDDPNYQLSHHEYASIAGVELRKTNSEPDFTISRQLGQYEKWVKIKRLGKRKSNITKTELMSDRGIHCTTEDNFMDTGTRYELYWLPNGDYVLARVDVPKYQAKLGFQDFVNPHKLLQMTIRAITPSVKGILIGKGNTKSLLSDEPVSGVWSNKRGIHHATSDGDTYFTWQTPSQIETLPVYTNGDYTEFLGKLHLWNVKEAKRKDRYKITNMKCQSFGRINQWISSDDLMKLTSKSPKVYTNHIDGK